MVFSMIDRRSTRLRALQIAAEATFHAVLPRVGAQQGEGAFTIGIWILPAAPSGQGVGEGAGVWPAAAGQQGEGAGGAGTRRAGAREGPPLLHFEGPKGLEPFATWQNAPGSHCRQASRTAARLAAGPAPASQARAGVRPRLSLAALARSILPIPVSQPHHIT